MKDIQVLIAGAAGEGIQTIGSMLAKVAQAQGYAVMAWQEFESRIRGGVNRFCVRIGKTPNNAPRYKSDILLGVNQEALEQYTGLVAADGIIFSQQDTDHEGAITIAFNKIAKEALGDRIYANVIALGTLCGALGLSADVLFRIIEKRFAHKSADIRSRNIKAAEKGLELAKSRCTDRCPWSLAAQPVSHYLIGCHEAIALAALYAGCRFIAAYPMSPSTDIITHLSRLEKDHAIFVETAEDEISAINMAVGAGFAGGRDMTATSGGGFALMNEGLSLAGMTETPVVIVVAMRPGPATGLPTRTAQEDLLYSLFAGHGEFPRVVLAPSGPLDAFHKTVKAFDLAEQYQVPVILLTDQFLADSLYSYTDFPLDAMEPRSHLADPAVFSDYKRYQITADGISPRLVPGQSQHPVGADSDEHDDEGHITENLGTTAVAMKSKRLAKGQALRRHMAPPEEFATASAEQVLICWGSSRNAVREAVQQLGQTLAHPPGMIHFSDIWPPPDYTFPEGKTYITVESNATGQLQQYLQMAYGLVAGRHIRRFDGLPLSAEYIKEHYRS